MHKTCIDAFDGRVKTQFVGFFLLILIIVGLLPFSDVATSIANTSSIYLLEGKRLANGAWPALFRDGVGRGPLFPYFVALVFKGLKPEPALAFYGMKFLFFSFLLAQFWLAQTAFNRRIAYLSTLFFLFSPQFYKFATFIDSTSLFIVLAALFVREITLPATSRGGDWRVGVLWGLLFLTRETALFWFPFVLFAWSKKGFRFRGRSLIAAMIIVLPWIGYCKWHFGSALTVLGHYNPAFIRAYSQDTFESSIASNFFLRAPLHLLGTLKTILLFDWSTAFLFGGVLLAKILRLPKPDNAKTSIIFLALILFYLPIPMSSYSFGSYGDVPRHALPIFVALIPLLTAHAWPIFEYAYIQVPRKIIAWAWVPLTLFCIFYGYQRGYAKYLRALGRPPIVQGRFTEEQRLVAMHLKMRCHPQTQSMITDGNIIEPLQFWTEPDCAYTVLPKPRPWRGERLEYAPLLLDAAENFSDRPDLRKLFYVWDRRAMQDVFKPKTIFVIGKNEDELWPLFEAPALLATELERTENVRVYELSTAVASVPFLEPVKVSERARVALAWIKIHRPEWFIKIDQALVAERRPNGQTARANDLR